MLHVLSQTSTDTSFLVQVVQGLVVALGAAYFVGNLIAWRHSKRSWSRYESDLETWQHEKKRARKKSERRPERPEEPEHPRIKTPQAVVQMVIGFVVALIGVASLTFDWL